MSEIITFNKNLFLEKIQQNFQVIFIIFIAIYSLMIQQKISFSYQVITFLLITIVLPLYLNLSAKNTGKIDLGKVTDFNITAPSIS